MSCDYMAPRHLQREVQLISNRYFLQWNNQIKRWELRAWLHELFGVRPRIEKVEDWIRRGRASNLVKRCFINDDQGHDIGFRPLSWRFVYECKRGVFNMLRFKYLLQEIDAHNQRAEESEDRENDYQHRGAAKAIYHHYREPTVAVHKDN